MKRHPARRGAGCCLRLYERTLGHARASSSPSTARSASATRSSYRLKHWPIWIFVFFIAPGPMTFNLFEHGFNRAMAAWLGAVLIGTGIAGLFGKLPGVEPRPYIIRFTEDRPNPLYRRICYTMAWSEAITFAVLNIAGLVVRDRHRRVAAAAVLRSGVLSDRRIDLGARRARAAAARQALDQGRGARAPLLLRIGVGRLHRAARAVVPLEGAAAHADLRRAQARRVRRHPRVGRQHGAPRPAAAHATDRPRRARGFRLICERHGASDEAASE